METKPVFGVAPSNTIQARRQLLLFDAPLIPSPLAKAHLSSRQSQGARSEADRSLRNSECEVQSEYSVRTHRCRTGPPGLEVGGSAFGLEAIRKAKSIRHGA